MSAPYDSAQRAWRKILLISLIASVTLFSIACSFNGSNIAPNISNPTFPAGERHAELWTAPDRWVLILNPYYHQGGGPPGGREPQYVWADKHHFPATINRLVGGEKAVLAPPDIRKKYAVDLIPPDKR